MKINIEKEIYVPSGIYCDKCFEKKERDGRTYCNVFGGWLYAANDGTGRIVKCVNCFESIQKTITERNY